jgi:hypothetical protein
VSHFYDLGTIWVGHLRNDAIYDPQVQGPISSIDYAYDLIHLNALPGRAVAFAFLIFQNETYYRPQCQTNVFDEEWTRFGSTGITAEGFARISGPGPGLPDFSADGTPIQFGYFSANSSTGATITSTAGIDNWSVAIHQGTFPYSFEDRGGISRLTEGSQEAAEVSYARILPNCPLTTPAGVSIFGLRQNGILVTEAGVPASPLIQAGRIYVEIMGSVATGVAIANPNGEATTISFFFTDTNGTDFGAGNTVIPARSQIAVFLNQEPFAGGTSIQGTFTFNSTLPVGVVALRGLNNERNEFLITTLPVSPLDNVSEAIVVFSHFADGGGWTTVVILINLTDLQITGSIQFLGKGSQSSPALPVTVTGNGQEGDTFPYAIPPRSSFTLRTSGSNDTTASGSIRVTPDPGNKAPAGLGIFSFRPAGITITEAGVPAIPAGTAFRMYVEASGEFGMPGSLQTGVAVTNLSNQAITVDFEITNLNGAAAGLSGSESISGSGQIALFLDQVSGLSPLPDPLAAILRISTASAAGVSIVGLRGRYNERGEFLITTTSPSNEDDTPLTTEASVPHAVDGGGYTTQIILFSGFAGQRSNGDLQFFSQTGNPTQPVWKP